EHDVTDRPLPLAQEVEDPAAVGFGDHLEHATSMPRQLYACQGMSAPEFAVRVGAEIRLRDGKVNQRGGSCGGPGGSGWRRFRPARSPPTGRSRGRARWP